MPRSIAYPSDKVFSIELRLHGICPTSYPKVYNLKIDDIRISFSETLRGPTITLINVPCIIKEVK